jgi:MFS family permease
MDYISHIKAITSEIIFCCLSDIKYAFCFLAITISRPVAVLFTVYCLMWIVSFVDSGVVEDDQHAQVIYQKITLTALVGVAICLPIVGWVSDKYGPHITIPLSFVIRALVLMSFLTIKKPDSYFSYAMCSIIIISSAMQASSIDALFLKSIPKEIRGAMVGTYNMFANVGTLLFTYYGGPAFDKIGPASPFIMIACGDWLVFLLAIILAIFGVLKS